MTMLFKKLRENDTLKHFFRQMSKYLENHSDEKENTNKVTKCDNNKKYQYIDKEFEKENDYFVMNNFIFLSRIFEYSNNFEKSEHQESNSDSKAKFDIGKIVTNKILYKQNEYNIKKVYTFYRECYKNPIDFGKTLIDFRREIVGEISDIIWEYHINEEILFLTTNFMDNIISKDQIRGKNVFEKLRYLGFTCLYITIKIERVNNLNFKEILKKRSLNIIKVLNMEKYVLSQLTFKLNPVSSLFILQLLMGILFESYLKDIIGIHNISYSEKPSKNKNEHKKSYSDHYNNQNTECFNSKRIENVSKIESSSSLIINVLNMKSSKGINKVLEYYISCYLLEICLYDIEILKYSPLCQAISVLLIAKECLGAGKEIFDKYNFNEYLREVIIEDYVRRNINAIKRTLKYPYIKKTCTTKKYLTNEYMNAANYVIRFICPK